MLRHDGHLRNSSVFTHFHSDSSAATSTALIKYEIILQRPGRNEEPTSRNEENTKNVPSS